MNKFTKWLIGVGVATSVIFILAWILKFWDSPFSGDPANWGVFGDYIGGTLATILAAGSFLGLMYSVIQQGQAMRKEWTLRNDESYNRQAIVCLERAFLKMRPNSNQKTPTRDRQAWIDCARLLLAAEGLGKRIKSKGFKAVFESERAHWQGQFFDLFDPDKDFSVSKDPEYFDNGAYGEAIEPRAVYVIYDFITWPIDRPDALTDIGFDWDLSKLGIFWPDQGAKAYLIKCQKALANTGS
ncbi:hypothetical protein [Pseudomonas sp. BN606]|jgi:hypothetical protein|uniref:hypothetical protein n=1 Tax=Pseudomonas sp. BN606 TaxID=2567894 RepID=UPI002458A8AD|nr:hypothetical protein [Pseudomonas sp. BN606]MDH4651707.1 hypothetical protein [Pseudomonas sp. BN606]